MGKINNLSYHCLVLMFLVLVPTFLIAQTGQIQGRVFDFDQNQPIANQLVILDEFQEEKKSANRWEAKTNKDGRYEIQDLPISLSTHYSVTTEIEGNTEQEKDIMITKWATSITVDLNLNAFTNDPQVIKILRHSLILRPLPDHAHGEAVQALEILRLENTSPFRFRQEINGQMMGCLMVLPAGAEQIQVGSANMEFTSENLNQNPVQIPAPILSGQTDLTISYILHVNKVIDLSRIQPFQTQNFQLLIPDSLPFFVQSKNLGDKSSQTIHNVVYAAYQTTAPIVKGETIQIQLKNAPSSTTLLIVLIVGLIVCIIGFVLTLVLRIRKSSLVEPIISGVTEAVPDASWLGKSGTNDLESTKSIRLEFIAHLDEMHKKGQVSDRVHKRIRREQVERLSATLVQLQK